MNTLIVRCEGDTPADTTKVIITLASGKTLTIHATGEPNVLSCIASGGQDTIAIYPRATNYLRIELK